MTSFMTGYIAFGITMICGSACSVEPEPASHIHEQALDQMQASGLQGLILQGSLVQGMTMKGFRFAGATLNGAALSNFRLENGELLAEQNSITLRGTALVNAHLFAEAQKKMPQQTLVIEYRITAIAAENPAYDPTGTGNTFLYTLQQNVDNTGTWSTACPVDHDGLTTTIPLADIWDDNGNRNSSAPLFTLACTVSSIADCYRWGYRPWVTGHGNLKITHWACTRLARADYCGDGTQHTVNGTLINVWDNLTPPIQTQGTTPPGMTFEAGWDQSGAICLSHTRWATGTGSIVALECPNKLHPPDHGSPAICDDEGHAGTGPNRLFNQSVIQ
jgi:hypothetical protein